MARTRMRKRKPTQASMNIDRISKLPDLLLLHIMSFLPTKTSVATCTLSRRWRHLWENLQAFEFFDRFYEIGKSEAPANFTHFVNTVLILRRVRRVQKFILSCEAIAIQHEVTTWIRAAIGPELQELNIALADSSATLEYILPQSIFTCTTLVSLTLHGLICLDQLSSVHLPSLKNLELGLIYDNLSEKLLRGCPVLETLVLSTHVWSPPSMYMPPSLKRLTFEDEIDEDIESLEIHTPSLEYLNIVLSNTVCLRFSASDLDNVVEAHLDIFPHVEHVVFLPKLLNMLYRTRYLELGVDTVKCLLFSPKPDFPQFFYLVHLKLEVPCYKWRFVIDMLNCCSVLRILEVQGMEEHSASWTRPAHVPFCLMFQLKDFVCKGYRDFADEHAFAAYILEKGSVLKTVKIYSDKSIDIEKKHDIIKGLSAIPRSCLTCQLIFR